MIAGRSVVGLPFPLPALALRHREDSFETIDLTGESDCALEVEIEDVDDAAAASEESSLPPLTPVIRPWLEVGCDTPSPIKLSSPVTGGVVPTPFRLAGAHSAPRSPLRASHVPRSE